MSELHQLKVIVERIECPKGKPIIESTGASVVTNVTAPVYNVSGSSSDPHIGGKAWATLFNDTMNAAHAAFPAQCFVGPSAPSGGNHNDYRVGGHMTYNSNNTVTGGTCLLMPLCSWHNSTARNSQAFGPIQSTMVQLTGYQLAEPAALFEARLDGKAAHAIVYETVDGRLTFRTFDEPPEIGRAKLFEDAAVSAADGRPDTYVELRRVEADGRTAYEIVDSRV